jgi:hypothetical protein
LGIGVFRFLGKVLGPVVFAVVGFAKIAAEPVGYLDHGSLTKRLQEIIKIEKKAARLETLAHSFEDREVWLVELGTGADEERALRPAMLLVAAAEGDDPASVVVATAWLERLTRAYDAGDDSTRNLLDTTTLYVIPNLNPDAVELYFKSPRRTSAADLKPFDDDHDGMSDEDGPEDLNGDGLITWMRVEDPEGEFIPDPLEPRLMVKADPARGETAGWRHLPEGVDNDKDERWNEDGPGGVNFNRNFPYQYEFFASDAGVNPVSEPIARALADFIVAHPNLGLVVTFGTKDTLVKTPDSAPEAGSSSSEGTSTTGRSRRMRKPPTAIDDKDIDYFKGLGKVYRRTFGLEKELESTSAPGTFSDWIYFHRGRMSLAVRTWSPDLQVAMEQGSKEKKKKEKEAEEDQHGNGEKNESQGSKKDSNQEKRNEKERKWLKWFDEHAADRFVPWSPIRHPDFPGRFVEIGGWAPGALTAPPESFLEKLVTLHGDFLTTAAHRLPRIAIADHEIKHLGKSVYELKATIENTGYLPTALAHGETTGEVLPTWVDLELPKEAFIAGERSTRLDRLAGSGGRQKVRWELYLPTRRTLRIEVRSALGGRTRVLLEAGGRS